ncbi:aldehyde dehydrogenase family protein [Nocardia sp. NPDC051750]|uniref:aldehyde dehydrogenase family protein n=1 Tax=Nocardia sp. NPDC051750 TaxID=3364325 RepID=UPI0037963222
MSQIVESAGARRRGGPEGDRPDGAGYRVAPDLSATLEAQRQAFRNEGPPDAAVRRDRIDRLLAMVLDNTDAYLDALTTDFGTRSRTGSLFTEIMGMLTAIEYVRAHLGRWMRPRRPGRTARLYGIRAEVRPCPLGVVGIIGPWNFPLNLVILPAATAFAAGNRVMIKMSEITSHTAELTRLLAGRYFDESELAVVTGGPEVGAAFTELPFDHLFFTGSTRVGRLVQRAAAANLVPVTLELGGKNPVVVATDADLSRAADRIARARMVNGGQVCVCPDYVLVPEDRIEPFVDALRSAWRRMFPEILGNADYTAAVNTANYERIIGLIEDARAHGAHVEQIAPAAEALPDPGTRKIAPTIIRAVTDEMAVASEEVFGPVLTVLPYRELTEVIDYINQRPAPLVAYWHGPDRADFRTFVANTRSGGVARNEFAIHMFPDNAPFGGVGDSGMGAYHGKAGFDTFSHHRTVVGTDLPVPITSMAAPPFGRMIGRVTDFSLRSARRRTHRRLRARPALLRSHRPLRSRAADERGATLTPSATGAEPLFTLVSATDAAASAIPDRALIVQGDRTHTYAQIADRSRRLAAYLHAQGLGCRTERPDLANHEVGQDLLGIYAYNGSEFVESMIGAFRARVAPFNVNYRYVENELHYLLADSGAAALVYHAAFAPTLAEVLPELPGLRVLIQIADSSGNALLDGAVDYETVIASTEPEPLPVEPSPDDLYVLYTGGTTGMPKGVLWRQHDIYMGACGGKDVNSGVTVGSCAEIAERAAANPGVKLLLVPPLIHGAAQWALLTAMTTGQTIVLSPVTDRIDAEEIVRTIEREQVSVAIVVGDALARPLLAAVEAGTADTSSLVALANGGAVLSPAVKERWIAAVPGLAVLDGVGSSETGTQMHHVSAAGFVSTGKFSAGVDTRVVAEDFGSVLEPGHDGIGWLAQRRFTPLGYKGDAKKTAATFPTIDGVRYVLPGDRARHLADGVVELLGRDSATINSGGEKIFAEEVEIAISSHPAVADVLVVARPSERWGQEVVAVVELVEGASAGFDDLVAHAAESLARYKLPKAVVFCPAIVRSPAGKADYRWAREQAAAAS